MKKNQKPIRIEYGINSSERQAFIVFSQIFIVGFSHTSIGTKREWVLNLNLKRDWPF